jgi:hypothetical protein
MHSLRVYRRLLQEFILCVRTRYKIAIHANITTVEHF